MNDLLWLSTIVCTQENVDTMLKDPQTPRYAVRRTHRTYTPQFKAELVAACRQPGVSIAAVALQHGMNTNVLHRWIKEWAQGMHRIEGGTATAAVEPRVPAFVPLTLSAAAATTASEQACVAASIPATNIRIECQRPGLSVTVHWPLSTPVEFSSDWPE